MKKFFAPVMEVVLFFLAALSFFPFIIVSVDAVAGVFVTGYRAIPAAVAYFMPTYFLILFHRLSHAHNEQALRHKATTNGAIIIGLSIYVIALDIAYFSLGVFHDLVEGGLAPLFPLDSLLISLLSCAIGAYLYLPRDLNRIFPITDSSKANRLSRFFSFLMKGIGTGFSLFMVGALLWGLSFSYWEHPSFPKTIPFFIVMIGIALLLAYDIYIESYPLFSFNKKRKGVILSLLSLCLIVGIIASLIVFIMNPDIAIAVCQPYFRFDAMASMNLAPFALLLPPSLYLVYLWIRFFLDKQTADR